MFEFKTTSGKRFKTFKQLEKAVGSKRAQAALGQMCGWVTIENGNLLLAGFAFFYSETMILYHAENELTCDRGLQQEFGRRIVEYFPDTTWKCSEARQEMSEMIKVLQRDEILVIADPTRGPKTVVVSERVQGGGTH